MQGERKRNKEGKKRGREQRRKAKRKGIKKIKPIDMTLCKV